MLDSTDFSILDELSKNSRITMKELGNKVHLTGQAAASRVAKLEDTGVIERYTIKTNQVKLGYYIHAFMNILIRTTQHDPYISFIKTQAKYLINNYKISGEGCYLLECKFTSNEELDKFLEALNRHANYKLSIVINKMLD
ncbi:HTH-type transcriptional regulator LrpA [Clostridium zeae]|uniref:HTH-type transcriptional regulator LrpA n=1 Tax=Clostridium zeae TaxID=2759022 RepID=A0ABQ1E5N8_9CLOT|nr:Lrp/AsnC family transcriptional regulator [Clostridium zeae]GFZ30044.1 HTH-type transcriptional regulator LrpA [Clostridium zeae]